MANKNDANELTLSWKNDARWKGIKRTYTAEDVLRLRGSVKIEYTLAQRGANRFWKMLSEGECITALGALTGNQAVQQVSAGLKAVYVSGWQVAADANSSLQTYPDQSLYPSDSVPNLVRRINSALQRADQIQSVEKTGSTDWYVPVVADAEAGFGGNLNAYELMKWMIEAGAAAVHFEDQLSSAKKCGHMGGKVLVPTQEAVQKLIAARLASDVMGVPTLIVARTDARGAYLITSDVDEVDRSLLTKGRTSEGFFEMKGGIESAIARGLAFAPYSDLIWYETSEPDLADAREFSNAIHKAFPGKWLAYNCSPSFNWKKKLDTKAIASFRESLHELGFRFQFITLAGFHTLNFSMFQLASEFKKTGMAAYADFQAEEFNREKDGYRATTHQKFVGTGYFDELAQIISGGNLSTKALSGSTEEEQFHHTRAV